MISPDPGVWLGVLFTFMVWSFLFKPTDLFTFLEYTIVGVSIGYTFVMGVQNIIKLGWSNLMAGQMLYLVPMILGLLLYANFFEKYRWVYRWPLAIMTGLGVGLAMRGEVSASFIKQIIGTIKPLTSTSPLAIFNNIVVVVSVVLVLYYFIFTVKFGEDSKSIFSSNRLRQAARILMMIGFGAHFGNVTTERFAYMMERVQYILITALGLG